LREDDDDGVLYMHYGDFFFIFFCPLYALR